MKKSKLRAIVSVLLNLIATHRRASVIILLVIVAFGVNAWRNWDDKQVRGDSETTSQSSEYESESEERPTRKIHIGWSNLALLGVCIGAIAFVKYKRSLKTKEEIKESRKEED